MKKTKLEIIKLVDGSTVTTGDFVPPDSYFSFCEALAETLAEHDPLAVEAVMAELQERRLAA
jgi:hypothetical protein